MRTIWRGALVVVVAALFPMGVAADFNVNITPPTLSGGGNQAALDAAADLLRNELVGNTALMPFVDQPLLANAFANAGAASAHAGTIRAFTDFRRFALILGTGVAAASPDISPEMLDETVLALEEEGDIYFGAAIQPINVALGINISRWLDRSRAFVKVGFIPETNFGDTSSFSSTSIGLGLNYQVLQSRQLPLGIIRWRGLSAGTGILYQQNTTRLSINTGGDFTQEVSNSGNKIGDLVIDSTLTAEIASRTVTIPLELTTGFRLLWGLEVNAGAGVDLAFGRSEVSLGSNSTVNFVSDTVGITQTAPGSANIGIGTTSSPDFLRPRITGGFGINLGPAKLDFPLMYYFDDEATGFVGGVNVGIVW